MLLVEKIVDSLIESPVAAYHDRVHWPRRPVTRYYETGENVGMWEKWFTENDVDSEAFMKLARNEEEGFHGLEELYVETKDPVLHAMSDFSVPDPNVFRYGAEQIGAYIRHMTDGVVIGSWRMIGGEGDTYEGDSDPLESAKEYVNGNYIDSKRLAKLLNLYHPDAYEVSDEEIDAVELD